MGLGNNNASDKEHVGIYKALNDYGIYLARHADLQAGS